ncbi:UNKNOWN [Stylonychia lemnae]|uniref:Uncharacterized protein n=1 Tax=Stylonychia lemnae TaxID=5949 RepID=A0A078ASB9_STYLE|nr:UNKNOWN [Stylonychia lemnae]|eukprot:CDW85074.1 UNKNOWN [Stylonychia lemnae]
MNSQRIKSKDRNPQVEGDFYPKSKREAFSKDLRQVHFTLGYDNNKYLIEKSLSQEHFNLRKDQSDAFIKDQKVETQFLKKDVEKKLFFNNFTIQDSVTSPKTQNSITQQFFTPKTNSKDDQPLNLEQKRQRKNKLQIAHFQLGSVTSREVMIRNSTPQVKSMSNQAQLNPFHDQHHKTKTKMIKHNFVLGIHDQDDTYRTSNALVTRHKIPTQYYINNLESAKVDAQKMKVTSYKIGLGTFSDNKQEGGTVSPLQKDNFHFKNQTQSITQRDGQNKLLDLRKSFLNMGNFQTVQQSVNKETFSNSQADVAQYSSNYQFQKDVGYTNYLKRSSVELKTERSPQTLTETSYKQHTQNANKNELIASSGKKIYSNFSSIFMKNPAYQSPEKTSEKLQDQQRKLIPVATLHNFKFSHAKKLDLEQTSPQKKQIGITNDNIGQVFKEKMQAKALKIYLKDSHYQLGSIQPEHNKFFTERGTSNVYFQSIINHFIESTVINTENHGFNLEKQGIGVNETDQSGTRQ